MHPLGLPRSGVLMSLPVSAVCFCYARCPLCRYVLSPESVGDHRCMDCDSAEVRVMKSACMHCRYTCSSFQELRFNAFVVLYSQLLHCLLVEDQLYCVCVFMAAVVPLESAYGILILSALRYAVSHY